MNDVPNQVVVVVNYGAMAYIAKSYTTERELDMAADFANTLFLDITSRWKSRKGRRGHKPAVTVYTLVSRLS